MIGTIETLLESAGVVQVLKDEEMLPTTFPAAVVVPRNWEGVGSAVAEYAYVKTKLKYAVFLVVEAPKTGAGYENLSTLVNGVRNAFLSGLQEDILPVEFYNGTANMKPVKIAKFEIEVG